MSSFQPESLYLTSDGEKYFDTSTKRQYFAALLMCLLSFGYGCCCGWPSAAVLLLTSDYDTPLESGPISLDDVGWIASGIGIGGFIGNLFFGWLSEKNGRKFALCVSAIPGVIGWLITYYATTSQWIIMSRVLMGLLGGGVFAVVPNYISEISDDHVRGRLGSFFIFFCNFGLLFALICGDFAEYYTQPWLLVLPILVFLIFFTFIPDSPASLLKRGYVNEAEKSILFFKSLKSYSKGAKECVDESLRKLQSDEEDNEEMSHTLTLEDFRSKSAKKGIIYGAILVALNQGCGGFAMITFTGTIFKEAGSSLSPNASSIIVGIIQIFGSLLATALVEKCGRKLMMSISALSTSLGHIILGFYALMQAKGFEMENMRFVPLFAFSFMIFVANLGILTLPFLILSEIVHPKTRGFSSTLCMSFCWSFLFIAVKYLPVLFDVIGMHGATFLFAFNSFIGALFIIFFLPETKGKSFEEIKTLLEK